MLYCKGITQKQSIITIFYCFLDHTVSANYEYLRSTADTESLVAIAKDIKRGKHIHFIEVEIYNDMAKLVAKGGFTYFVQK